MSSLYASLFFPTFSTIHAHSGPNRDSLGASLQLFIKTLWCPRKKIGPAIAGILTIHACGLCKYLLKPKVPTEMDSRVCLVLVLALHFMNNGQDPCVSKCHGIWTIFFCGSVCMCVDAHVLFHTTSTKKHTSGAKKTEILGIYIVLNACNTCTCICILPKPK